jgi:rubredoxin
LKKWECAVCGFVYDESVGEEGSGLAPGTRWEDVPDDWQCSDCDAAKSEFKMVEI